MSQRMQAAILVLLGGVLLRLAIFGEYLNYVRAVMRPYLLATGSLFVVLGVVEAVRATRRAATTPTRPDWRQRFLDGEWTPEPAAGAGHGDGHDEPHPAAWLLCVPAFLALLIAPPALGSYVANRAGATVPRPAADTVYRPLPPGPVQLGIRDYAQRAVWDRGRTLQGHTITLTGFVTPSVGETWYLARLHIVCCAADALTAMVEIDTDARTPTRDTWISVTGTFVPSTDTDPVRAVPRLAATSLRTVHQPTDPYE